MAEPPFLTIPEFCAEYRTSRSYTFVLLRERRLKGVKVGKMTRIRRKDAQAWAKALPPAGRATPKSDPKPAAIEARQAKPVIKAPRKWRRGGPGRPPKDAAETMKPVAAETTKPPAGETVKPQHVKPKPRRKLQPVRPAAE